MCFPPGKPDVTVCSCRFGRIGRETNPSFGGAEPRSVRPSRSMTDPYLAVRIAGRERPERIALTDGDSVQDELARFLNRQGPYAQMWIRLASGEYVRYEAIESIALPS